MAVTIASTSRAWYESGTTIFWTARPIWDTGSALYVITQDTGASPKLRVRKANSRTAPTTFAEQDSANNKAVNAATAPWDAWYDGTRYIHVFGFSAANSITHWRFDTSTDLWTTAHGVATTSATQERGLRAYSTTADDPAVVYVSSSDDADLGLAGWVTSAWQGANNTLLSVNSTEASTPVEIRYGASNNVVYFYNDVVGDDFTAATFSGGGSKTEVDIDSSIQAAETGHSAGGSFAPFMESGTNKLTAAYIEADGTLDASTVSLDTNPITSGQIADDLVIEATATNVGARTPLSTARLGTTDYCIWWDDASSGTIYYATKTAGTWGGRTAWKTTHSRPVQLLTVDTGLLAVYQSDATTMAMDWIVTASGDASATMTRDTLTVSGKAVTATGQRHETATMTADTLSISGKALTATAGASATMTADALTVVGQSVTGTGQRNETATVTADALTVSGKVVTGTASLNAEATMTRQELSLSGKALTATGQRNETGTITAETLSVIGKTLTATGQRNETATMAADALAVSGKPLAASSGVAATVTDSQLSIVGNTLSASAGSSAILTGASPSVEGENVSASAGASAVVDASELVLSGKTLTATAGSSNSAEATVSSDSLTIVGHSFTASGQANASATVVAGEASVFGQPVTAEAGVSAAVSAQGIAVSGKSLLASVDASASLTSGALSVAGKSITTSAGSSASITRDVLAVVGRPVTGLALVPAVAEFGGVQRLLRDIPIMATRREEVVPVVAQRVTAPLPISAARTPRPEPVGIMRETREMPLGASREERESA
jgi:hypothetical protein